MRSTSTPRYSASGSAWAPSRFCFIALTATGAADANRAVIRVGEFAKSVGGSDRRDQPDLCRPAHVELPGHQEQFSGPCATEQVCEEPDPA